jgi:hypothetical protein
LDVGCGNPGSAASQGQHPQSCIGCGGGGTAVVVLGCCALRNQWLKSSGSGITCGIDKNFQASYQAGERALNEVFNVQSVFYRQNIQKMSVLNGYLCSRIQQNRMICVM